MEYKNVSPFINRQNEITSIQQWIEEEPKKILFLFGPKSSGKTTLIYKVVDEHLNDEQKYSVKLFNLREVLLVNYEDFLQRFFQLEDQEAKNTPRPGNTTYGSFCIRCRPSKKYATGSWTPLT